jgi:uncharacterized protein
VKADETRALIPGRPIQTNAQRDALRRVADKVIADGMEASGLYRAARDLLLRKTPRTRGTREGRDLVRPGEEGLTAAKRLGLDLDESYLPIQGPPASGKTYTGARMIVEFPRHGKKVGFAATAHKAISNLVDEVCVAARDSRTVPATSSPERRGSFPAGTWKGSSMSSSSTRPVRCPWRTSWR